MTAHVESSTEIDPDRVVIRPLTGADRDAYRRLRQRILELGDGRYFSTSYAQEQQLTTEAEWSAWCSETPVRCMIGTFVDGELVGVAGIAGIGDRAARAAEWNSTWMDPRYRRSGLANQQRARVRAWSYEHGYRYAITDIRADNKVSRGIREREGAMYLFTERDVAWADGSTADAHYFMLNLAPGAETSRSPEQAVAFLEAALAFVRLPAHAAHGREG